MPTQDVRFSQFAETEPLELPLHWRNLLENRQGFYDFLVYYQDYYDELEQSSTAKKVINDIGYSFPDSPTGE